MTIRKDAAPQWAVYGTSNIERILSKLEHVRQVGTGQWYARCPAHEDKRPSLSIKQTEDGTILMHDHAGCSTADILGAVGLEVKDLFPRPLKPRTPEERKAARKAFQRDGWDAALSTLAHEAYIIEIAAGKLAEGPLAPEDHERLVEACQRVHAAREELRR